MKSEKEVEKTSHSSDRHIVDILIEERAVNLMKRPMTWRLIRTFLYGLLHYEKAIEMANDIAPLSGRGVFDYLSDRLQLNIDISGLEHVPKTGKAIVTPNHPAGIADGIAVYDALKDLRDDIIFLANRDAIRAAPALSEIVVPVEWRDEFRTPKRNRETVQALIQAIRDERLLVIFPSGRLARPTIRGLQERPWQITALNIAKKYDVPVIPMNIQGHNSLFYYSTWFINTELKDMTLFRELLNKQGQQYQLTLGEAIRIDGDVQAETEKLRDYVLSELGNRKRNSRIGFESSSFGVSATRDNEDLVRS